MGGIIIYYKNRDRDLEHAKARKGHSCYGMGIGIIILDDVYPGFPGDVRNASAFPYPVQYEIVENVDTYRLVREEDKSPCKEPTLQAAKKLEKMGCRAIAAECGYFAYFQKDVASYVNIPVFMSSLLQVSFIQELIGPEKYVGIICAQKKFLSDKHLENVGINLNSNYIIAGAQDEYNCPEFDNLWNHEKRPSVPEIYYNKAEKDMINVCKKFYERNQNIGALMLECTGMQPFARAIQRKLDLPVFSWGTLLDYAYSVVVHRDFYGHV